MKYFCPKCSYKREFPFDDLMYCPICNTKMNKEIMIVQKKYKPLDKMMMNIIEFSEEEIWKDIESISNPLERANQKGLYYMGIKQLKRKFKGKKLNE